MSEESAYGRARYRKVILPNNGFAETWLERLGERAEMHTKHQLSGGGSGSGSGGYLLCKQHGCLGEALSNSGACFAHADETTRVQLLNQLPGSNRALSLRGNTVSQALWEKIVESPIFAGGVLRAPIVLAGAEINASIRLRNIEFEHYFDLTSASVFQHIELTNCSLKAHFNARHALFNGGAINCKGSIFHQDFDLSFATVKHTSFGFQGCTFNRAVNFDGLDGAIHLDGSMLHGNFTCRNSKAFLIMNSAELHGAFDLTDSELVALHGERLIAHSVLQIGPCAIPYLQLRRAIFNSRVHVDISATDIDLTGAVMKEGGLLLIEKAKIRMEQLNLGGPLRISGNANSLEVQPEILGLLNSDAGQMSLSRVDLTRCSFVGAHDLGNIEIDATVTFGHAPRWAGGRRFIADEFAWRSRAGRWQRIGWKLEGVHVGTQLPQSQHDNPKPVLLTPLTPPQVESLYRELRRGLEAKSNMPGAADFYFGEMEMRRLGGARRFFERFLISCYWLLSEYGLRPGRALLAWSLLVVVGTASLLELSTPTDSKGLPEVFLIAVRASVPGFVSYPGLDLAERWIETGIRILGVVIVTLFVLAIRSVVMRKPSE